MRRPVSTLLREECVEGAVLGGVVGRVALPAAPEDAGPGASEDAQGVGVVAAADAGALVDVSWSWVPASCAVGKDAHVFAQALVADLAEGSVVAFSGLDCDWGLAGVGGERVVGGVAPAVIADLGDQPGGGDSALLVAEDRSVGVDPGSAGDLSGELAALLNGGATPCRRSGCLTPPGGACLIQAVSAASATGRSPSGAQRCALSLRPRPNHSRARSPSLGKKTRTTSPPSNQRLPYERRTCTAVRLGSLKYDVSGSGATVLDSHHGVRW